MADNYLEKIREVERAVLGSVDYLRYLARAFETVRNLDMAERLLIEAHDLDQAMRLLKQAVDQRLSADLEAAQRGSAAALEFGLAYAAAKEKK